MLTRSGTTGLLAACAVAAAVFAPTLSFGFVWDDRSLILHNPWLASWRDVEQAFHQPFWAFLQTGDASGTYYRPLVHWVNFLVRSSFGSSPSAFHAVQVALHVLCTGLVGLLADRLAAHRSPALVAPHHRSGQWVLQFSGAAAALVFAVHPIHTEAVAWASGLADVGATAALLAALVVTSAPGRVGWPKALLLALLCWAAPGLKETGLLAAPLAVSWVVLIARGRLSRGEGQRLAAGAALGVGIALVMRWLALADATVLPRHAGLSRVEVWMTGLSLGAQQVTAVLWPTSLSAWHTLVPVTSLADPRVGGALALFAAGAAAAAWAARGRPEVLYVLLFAAVAALPGTLVPRLGENAFAERYVYLLSVALSWGIALLVRAAVRASLERPVIIGLAALAAGLWLVTWGGLPPWKDERAFFTEMERVSPEAAPLGQNLGVVYLEAGSPERALAYFKRSSQDSADFWSTRAVAHAQLRQWAEAEQCLRRSLAKVPHNAPALANLCKMERLQGRLAEALVHCEAAVQVDPRLAQTRSMYGSLLRALGRAEDARREFEAALALDPGHLAAKENLAELR